MTSITRIYITRIYILYIITHRKVSATSVGTVESNSYKYTMYYMYTLMFSFKLGFFVVSNSIEQCYGKKKNQNIAHIDEIIENSSTVVNYYKE